MYLAGLACKECGGERKPENEKFCSRACFTKNVQGRPSNNTGKTHKSKKSLKEIKTVKTAVFMFVAVDKDINCCRCERLIPKGEKFYLRTLSYNKKKSYEQYSRCAQCIEPMRKFKWVIIT